MPTFKAGHSIITFRDDDGSEHKIEGSTTSNLVFDLPPPDATDRFVPLSVQIEARADDMSGFDAFIQHIVVRSEQRRALSPSESEAAWWPVYDHMYAPASTIIPKPDRVGLMGVSPWVDELMMYRLRYWPDEGVQ